MNYTYSCNKCSLKPKQVAAKKDEELVDYDIDRAGWHPKTGEYIFVVSASMKAIPVTPACPKCSGNDTERTYTDSNFTSYIRGNCYLDKVGAKRDMYRHKLKHEDPYGNMRVSGELDHMDNKFRRAGMDMAKVHEKHTALVREAKAKSTVAEMMLTEDEKAVIIFINKNDAVDSGEMVSLVPDINKVLTELASKHIVLKNRAGKFVLQAEGRWMADRI